MYISRRIVSDPITAYMGVIQATHMLYVYCNPVCLCVCCPAVVIGFILVTYVYMVIMPAYLSICVYCSGYRIYSGYIHVDVYGNYVLSCLSAFLHMCLAVVIRLIQVSHIYVVIMSV